MNWDAVSAIGQVAGVLLVGVSLVYLAIRLRQNTAALKSSTFLSVSTQMGANMEIFASLPDVAPLFIKAQAGLDALSAAERVRFGFLMMMAFRRVETVVVQRHLGEIDPELTVGFERSAMSALRSPGTRQWWETAKGGFSDLFSAWVDRQLTADLPTAMHAGLGLSVSDGP
jgi:hypothetical protein